MIKPYKRCEDNCKFIEDGVCVYNKKHINTVAIDFDRTIFTHDKWNGHEHIGDVIDGAKEGIDALRKMGFKIMIWTTRSHKDVIEKALKLHNIYYDYINMNPNQPPETNISKPMADYYIDDRAVRFTDWVEVLKEINERVHKDDLFPLKNKED